MGSFRSVHTPPLEWSSGGTYYSLVNLRLRTARLRLLSAFAASERLADWRLELAARRAANDAYLAECASILGYAVDIHGRRVA